MDDLTIQALIARAAQQTAVAIPALGRARGIARPVWAAGLEAAEAEQPFRLSLGPLLRGTLLRLGPQDPDDPSHRVRSLKSVKRKAVRA